MRQISIELDELAAAHGLGEAFIHGACEAMLDMLHNQLSDLIEAVAFAAPGTGNFVVRLRISARLRLALASAAKNFNVMGNHQSITFH